MRRYLAGTLLVLMVMQSSGAAAASVPRTAVTGVNWGDFFRPLESAVVSSRLYAVATDTEDRYGDMHAPPPRMQKPERTVDGVALMRSRRVLRPDPRPGVAQVLRLPPRSVLISGDRTPDPRAMRRSATPSSVKTEILPAAGRGLTLLASSVAPNTPSTRFPGARNRSRAKQALASNAGTGIEHWWTYEEQPIPGLGKALLNVGTGNLIVSATDANVPEQGINLALQRTYNSQSLHDVNGDDGGEPAIFGNGWTNNFDANIVYNGTSGTITVYDLDGAACTYTASGNGNWIPCTGEHAQLAVVPDSHSCQYTWTKPNGTVYLFASDGGGSGLCTAGNLRGHLVEIVSRNSNNYITFTYYYDSSGTHNSEHVTEIDADHSDGDKLIMTFGLLPGSINELSSITRPDQSVLDYWYDKSGNLEEVDKPGNNSASNLPGNPHSTWTQGDLPETYAYNSGTSQMAEACGPRCTAAMWANNNPKAGAALTFQYTNSDLTVWQVQGVLNFTPDDGTGSVLNATAPTGWQQWNTTNFQYGSSGICGSSGSGTTYMCDQDGHAAIWTLDGSGRVTKTKKFAVNQWITTQAGWDDSNDLISTTDANQNVTQYGYDGSGNMVEMQLPNATDFTIGGNQGQSLMPLSFYSYDSSNNVLAYCDPFWTQKHGKTWVTNPGDNLCPSTSGTAYFVYKYDQTNEPYGCVTDMYKPGGYHTGITYGGACGVGLPTEVQGDSIKQYGTNPSRRPTQDFVYGQNGQVKNYDRGSDGSVTYDSWTLSYNPSGNHDNLNTEQTENDPTISGNDITSFTCYYPDGSVFYTETPSQHGADGGNCPSTSSLLQGSVTPPAEATAHYYDYDGDEVESASYKGCSSNNSCANTNTSKTRCSSSENKDPIGTTCKYYDGLDRLVETAQPYDVRDFSNSTGYSTAYEFYTFRWMNRYIYDLSLSGSNGSLTISDLTGSTGSFAAYGNLYETEEYLPQFSNMHGCYANTNDCQKPNNGQYSNASWSAVRGTSFDSLDRSVSKYELAFGTGIVTTNSYDANGEAGLLSSVANAVGQTTTYTYDSIVRIKSTQFSQGDGDSRSYQFDPDGRTASVAGHSFGEISYTYDVDGNQLSVTEPTKNSGYPGGSLICYQDYPDGLREYLSIGNADLGVGNCGGITANGNPSNGGISQPNIFSYAYTGDGRLAEQDVNWGTNAEDFSWAYKPSGRQVSETDPLSGQDAYTPYSQTTKTPLLAKSYTYDTYGRLKGVTLPGQYQQSSLIYDEEDELAGYTPGRVGTSDSGSRPMILNARGEMIEDGTEHGSPQAETQSANGAQVGNGDYVLGTIATYQSPPTTLEYDLRSNMVTCSSDPAFAKDYSYNEVYPYVYRYDKAGRQTKSGYDTTTEGSTTCDSSQAGGTSTYDAENHIQSSSIYQAGGTATWGPDGRQRISIVGANQTQTTETAHWDGDSILFATGGNITPQLYIGEFGVMDYAGDIDVYDRDQTGAKVSSHGVVTGNLRPPWMIENGNWVDGWSAGSVRTIQVEKSGKQYYFQWLTGTCNAYFIVGGSTIYFACPAVAATFEMERADGYKMVGGIVQGARTFDSTSGGWLTPDAHAGDVNDPMSQKPFVWNNNNPMEYSDPSGYDAVSQGVDGSGAQTQNGPPPGAPGSACAATDSSGACYQQGQAINPYSNTHMNGYSSLADAAAAAQAAYSFIKTAGEVGCEVYCNGGDCGFGVASVARENPDGSSSGPQILDSAGVASTATDIGTWHSHPDGAPTDDMEEHNTFAQSALRQDLKASEASVYTSEQGNPMQVQTYTRATQTEYVPPSNVPPQ
jgi:YD repeat-containing protein